MKKIKFPLTCAFLSSLLLVNTSTAYDDNDSQKAENGRRNANSISLIYQQGVPQVDKNGRRLMGYDAKKSFFPIAAWGVPLPGVVHGHDYKWEELKQAGFNTVWPWFAPAQAALEAGEKTGMQIVLMTTPEDGTDLKKLETVLTPLKNHPNLLGNVWTDEPIGHLTAGFDMDAFYQKFLAYKEKANSIAPDMPVFINDAPWIMAPATSWWVKWNTAGDISCHDNYPCIIRNTSIKSINAEPNGIAQSVTLATASNKETKPVWLIVGAFEQITNMDFPSRFCTPVQLRAQVYSGIIHGATGIAYFIWDSYISRDAGCIGISPDPKLSYVPNPKQEGYPNPTPATPNQLIQSRALWQMTEQINSELNALAPIILSPTVSDVQYKIDIVGPSATSTPITCMLKRHPEGGYVLLTVNGDDSVLTATFTFPDKLTEVLREFENQPALKLSEDGKSFTVRYEPFDTHVLRIK